MNTGNFEFMARFQCEYLMGQDPPLAKAGELTVNGGYFSPRVAISRLLLAHVGTMLWEYDYLALVLGSLHSSSQTEPPKNSPNVRFSIYPHPLPNLPPIHPYIYQLHPAPEYHLFNPLKGLSFQQNLSMTD